MYTGEGQVGDQTLSTRYGKTYHTVLCAVAIIEGKDISDIKQEDYIEVKKDMQNIEMRIELPLQLFINRMDMKSLLKESTPL